MSKNYGLEKIANEYDFILFDSSALIDPFGTRNKGGHNRFTCYEKTICLQKKIDYILFLQECLKKRYPFYITKEVMDEINKGGNFARRYKAHIRNSKYNSKKRVFVSPKTIEKENCEFNRLISFFVNNDGLINLTAYEKKIYSGIYLRFLYFKKLRELSETDFDLFIKAIILSDNRGKTAILTNDLGINDFRLHLSKKKLLNTLDLDLFKSFELEYFVKSEDYFLEKKKFNESQQSFYMHTLLR